MDPEESKKKWTIVISKIKDTDWLKLCMINFKMVEL